MWILTVFFQNCSEMYEHLLFLVSNMRTQRREEHLVSLISLQSFFFFLQNSTTGNFLQVALISNLTVMLDSNS